MLQSPPWVGTGISDFPRSVFPPLQGQFPPLPLCGADHGQPLNSLISFDVYKSRVMTTPKPPLTANFSRIIRPAAPYAGGHRMDNARSSVYSYSTSSREMVVLTIKGTPGGNLNPIGIRVSEAFPVPCAVIAPSAVFSILRLWPAEKTQ